MKRLDNQGVTLVELLTAIFITVIIGSVAFGFLFVTMKRYDLQSSINNQSVIIDYVGEIIDERLRYGQDIIISGEDEGSYDSSYDRIYLSDSQIVINNAFLSKETMSEYEVSLSFSKVNDSCIEVFITLSDETLTSEQTIVVRFLNEVEIIGNSASSIYFK